MVANPLPFATTVSWLSIYQWCTEPKIFHSASTPAFAESDSGTFVSFALRLLPKLRIEFYVLYTKMFKKRLRVFVKKTTPAPLLLSKFIRTPAGVHFYTPAPVHYCHLSPPIPETVVMQEKETVVANVKTNKTPGSTRFQKARLAKQLSLRQEKPYLPTPHICLKAALTWPLSLSPSSSHTQSTGATFLGSWK